MLTSMYNFIVKNHGKHSLSNPKPILGVPFYNPINSQGEGDKTDPLLDLPERGPFLGPLVYIYLTPSVQI